MAEEMICKTKECHNPVLDGKYCEHCKQVRKERKNTAFKVAGSAAIAFAGAIVKTGVWKKIPGVAAKAVRAIFKL